MRKEEAMTSKPKKPKRHRHGYNEEHKPDCEKKAFCHCATYDLYCRCGKPNPKVNGRG